MAVTTNRDMTRLDIHGPMNIVLVYEVNKNYIQTEAVR